MKLFILIFVFAVVSTYLCGCDENLSDADNPDPTGCSKSSELIYPSNDTSINKPTVTFRWFQPRCYSPSLYRLFIYRDNISNPYDTIPSSGTIASVSLPVNFYYYWKVVAYYDGPTPESATSQTYKFFSEP